MGGYPGSHDQGQGHKVISVAGSKEHVYQIQTLWGYIKSVQAWLMFANRHTDKQTD